MAISTANLNLAKHCNLFKVKKDIDGVLRKEVQDLIDNTRILHETLEGDITIGNPAWRVVYHFVSFYHEQIPSFFTENTPIPNKERKYGYLLLCQYSDTVGNKFLTLNKKNISLPKNILEDYIENIDKDRFTKIFVNNQSEIKRINLSNINFSDYSIRKTQAEAKNIAKSYSVLSASDKMINSLQSLTKNALQSVLPNSFKVNELGEVVSFDQYNTWVTSVLSEYLRPTTGPNLFIKNFAKSESFSNHSATLKFDTLLILKHDLVDLIEQKKVDIFLYDKAHKKINLKSNDPNYTLLDWLNEIDLCFDIDANNNFSISNFISGKLENKHDSIKIIFDGFNDYNLRLLDTNEPINIQTYFNQKGLFIVSFKKSKFKYIDKFLYEENFPIGIGDEFINSFVAINGLKNTTEEKGIVPNATRFSKTSIFHEIIKEVKSTRANSALVCDDMGTEWADFIGIHNKQLSFYHAKHAHYTSGKFSVSDFHIVVSQAQKNIGNMFFTEKLNAAKFKKWEKPIKGTKINKLQIKTKGLNSASFGTQLSKLISNANIERELIIVVDFISKSTVENEIKKHFLKTGKGNCIQFIWLLSSLYHTCIERNIKLKIWCRA